MSDDAMSWPDADVHWQGVLDANPDFSIPFATHVFVFHTCDQLRSACGRPDAVAHSTTFVAPDPANVGALLFFSLEDLALSLVAHEATHVALIHHSQIEQTRIGAKRWLHDHPETIAEMVGNLTSIVWARIRQEAS